MPIALIALHEKANFLPPAAYGMLWRLLGYHWITGKPIPKTDQGILAIVVAHYPTWMAHKADIKEILADVLPKLAKAKERKIEMRQQLNSIARIGAATNRARALDREHRARLENSARSITLPQRTQTQTRINVEKRTKRQDQNTFVETHF